MRLDITRGAVTALNAVSTDSARSHLRVTNNEDYSYIATLVAAATEVARTRTNRQFIRATYSYYLDEWPETELVLPYPPYVASSIAITYTDTNGATQTLSSSVYRVDGTEPGILRLAWDQSWPDTRAIEEAICVTWIAGYGTTPDSVPAAIQAAILLHVGHLYEHREAVDIINAAAVELPFAYSALLGPYRWPAMEGKW